MGLVTPEPMAGPLHTTCLPTNPPTLTRPPVQVRPKGFDGYWPDLYFRSALRQESEIFYWQVSSSRRGQFPAHAQPVSQREWGVAAAANMLADSTGPPYLQGLHVTPLRVQSCCCFTKLSHRYLPHPAHARMPLLFPPCSAPAAGQGS